MTSIPPRVLLFTALAMTAMHAQAPTISMPPGSNVLLGRVVEMGTDAPVGGAIVTLTGQFDASGKSTAPNPGARGTDVPPSVYVMTTADGAFVFRNLPAGRFTAATRALGYLNNDYPPTQIDIRDSQKAVEIRLRVWKYAAMGGRVVDERGDPISGIPVTALERLSAGGSVIMRRAATGVTDDRGVYRLAQMPPGAYAVAVLSTSTTMPEHVAVALDPAPANRAAFTAMRSQLNQGGSGLSTNSNEGHHIAGFVFQRPGPPLPLAPDGRLLGFANTFYPGTSRANDATLVSLGSGESRTDLDLTVRLTAAVSVSGVLIGPDGPMSHAVVSLVPPGTDVGDLDPAGLATAVTDERGAFVFLAIAPGQYTLGSAAAIGYNMSTGEGRPLWAAQSLNVGEADITGLTITLQPGVRTNGRVEFRSPTGIVPNPSSQRHVITLQPVYAQAWSTLQGIVQPDGTFSTAGDPPGRYLINASSPPGWYRQTTFLNGRPLLDEVIELGSGELSGLVLTYGQTTNRISGQVSDDAGAPDADAMAIVFPADSNSWREGIFTSSRRTRAVRATSAGSYQVAALAPGEYYVAAVSSRLALNWQNPQFLERLIAGAAKVTLGATDEKTAALRTITVRGER